MCNVDDFAKFGVGYSLYFRTVILLMTFIAFQLSCCILYTSLTDKPTLVVTPDPFYDEFLFITTLFFVYWLRYKMMRYYMYLETTINPNIAEFSIALSNLPQNCDLSSVEQEIRELFEGLNHYNGINYHVHDVVFCFDTSDYLHLLAEQDAWKNRLLDHYERDLSLELGEDQIEKTRLRREKREFYAKKIEALENRILNVEKEFQETLIDGKPSVRFTGKAMVVFKTQMAAYDIIEKYNVSNPILYRAFVAFFIFAKYCCTKTKNNAMGRLFRPLINDAHYVDRNQIIVFKQTRRLNLFFRDRRLYVIKAVNPNNILWPNFGYTFYQKYLFRTCFFSFSLMILALSFVLVRSINNYRYYYFLENEVHGFRKFALNSLISLTILLFNNILNQFILHTIQFECHEKRTNELTSQINKIVLRMFLNTTVMIFLLCFNGGTFDVNFLMYQVLLLDSITAFISPFFGFWDFSYFLRLLRRYRIYRQAKIKETQAYVTKVFENPEYNIVLNYSGFIFHFMNLICFCNFFPFWVFFLILIYYIFHFLLQKKLFITRNSVINEFRSEVNNSVLNIIDVAPFLMLIAQYLRNSLVFKNSQTEAFFWIKLLLAVWTMLFPNERLLEYLFLKINRNFGDLEKYRESFRNWNYTKKNPAYFSLRRARCQLNN